MEQKNKEAYKQKRMKLIMDTLSYVQNQKVKNKITRYEQLPMITLDSDLKSSKYIGTKQIPLTEDEKNILLNATEQDIEAMLFSQANSPNKKLNARDLIKVLLRRKLHQEKLRMEREEMEREIDPRVVYRQK